MTTNASNGRAMASVWLCAVMIAVGGMVGLLRLTPGPLQPPPFGVFIGTSVIRLAFPAEHPASDIFRAAEAGDLFVRMASDALSDADTLEGVRRAVRAGVKKIFVEIDPLLRTFRGRPATIAISREVEDFSNRLRGAARPRLGLVNDSPDEEIYQIYDGDIRKLGLAYRLDVHEPRESAAIAEALEIARRQGLDIVWVAMPRSQAVAAYLGSPFETAFSAQLQAFAATFNATVWRPAIFWPNELFADPIHVNTAGRTRFMSELRLYGATMR